MSLLPRDFYDMSPRNFSLMIKGHEAKKVDEYKQNRMLMFTLIRLMGDPKTAPKTPEEFWSLPGDEEKEVNTEEEYREIFKRLRENG